MDSKMDFLKIIRTGILSTFDFNGHASRKEFWLFCPMLLALSFTVYAVLIPMTDTKNAIVFTFVVAAGILAPTMSMAARRANEAGLSQVGAQYGGLISLFGLGLYHISLSSMVPASAVENFSTIAIFLFVLGLAILTRIGLKPPLNHPPNEAPS